MEIKFHSFKERPVRSCEVITLNKWLDLYVSNYSRNYDKFNVKDVFSKEDAEEFGLNEDIYLGWVYADELRWQMVRCADEIQ